MKKTIHIEVSGKVQGVYFRASAWEAARALQLKGWIRNHHMGKVEAVVSGEAEELERFVAWCRHGPARAKVEDVVVQQTYFQEFDSFEIRR